MDDDDDDDVEVVVIMDRLVSCTYDVADLLEGVERESNIEMMIRLDSALIHRWSSNES